MMVMDSKVHDVEHESPGIGDAGKAGKVAEVGQKKV